ncbi:MAG: membrane integrity-associated transporter subunit PqiC [Candidatus Hydrogenedentes bacterium]|nr:membrane integrity-associated transporter subunit PqiC [Candidatus Hydrogenedentota bacterium]
MHRLFGVILAVACAAGCVTAPGTRYYTLDMTRAAQDSPVNLVVDRLQASEALTRKNILIKNTPTQVEYYAADEWAADVAEMITQKLESEFGPRAEGRPTLLLSGTVLAFEQVDASGGAQAHARLALELRTERGSRLDQPLLEKTYEVLLPAAAPQPNAVVVALGEGLEQIAAEIMADAARVAPQAR